MSPSGIFSIFLLAIISFTEVKAEEFPKAENGFLDVSTWNFVEKKIPLSGQWMYFDHQLVSPSNIHQAPSTFTTFPTLWNDFRDSKSGVGFATYAIKISVSENTENLALDIPQIYSNYTIWVNGEIVAKNGIVGKTKDESQPQWLPQTVIIPDKADSLTLVIQLSNFHHHKGGSKDPIMLGASSQLLKFRQWIVQSNLAEAIVLSLLALAFLMIYFKKGRKKVVMYFLLLCLTWAIRTLFSNEYVFISFFPSFNWELMVKIEYLTLYFTMIWAILFLGRLFINESGKWMKYFLVTGNIAFVVFTILTPAISYTRWLPAYLGLSFILIAYGLLIVIMALLNDRAGVINVVVGVILGLVIFGYDLLSFEGVFVHNSVIFSVSYIVIFILLGIALLRHLKVLKNPVTDEMSFDDLYKQDK